MMDSPHILGFSPAALRINLMSDLASARFDWSASLSMNAATLNLVGLVLLSAIFKSFRVLQRLTRVEKKRTRPTGGATPPLQSGRIAKEGTIPTRSGQVAPAAARNLRHRAPTEREQGNDITSAPFRQIVDQAVRIFDVASRKRRFVLYYYAALFRQVLFGLLDIFDGNFQNGSKSRTWFDKQIDVLAVEANYIGILVRNFKPEFLDVEAGGFHGIFGLNQNIGA